MTSTKTSSSKPTFSKVRASTNEANSAKKGKRGKGRAKRDWAEIACEIGAVSCQGVVGDDNAMCIKEKISERRSGKACNSRCKRNTGTDLQ